MKVLLSSHFEHVRIPVEIQEKIFRAGFPFFEMEKYTDDDTIGRWVNHYLSTHTRNGRYVGFIVKLSEEIDAELEVQVFCDVEDKAVILFNTDDCNSIEYRTNPILIKAFEDYINNNPDYYNSPDKITMRVVDIDPGFCMTESAKDLRDSLKIIDNEGAEDVAFVF